MARGFRRRHGAYVAKLDAVERGLVVGLMEQVRELVAPEPTAAAPPGGDEFDAIIAGLGGMGLGVSVSSEDQQPGGAGGARSADHEDDEPRDPALNRLIPVANREDGEAASEFRRLTEQGLRTRKTHNLTVSIEALQGGSDAKVSLDRDQAFAMMVALTDVRLVLGERLGLKTDEDVEAFTDLMATFDEDDPAVYAMAVYDFLTYLQDSLVDALAR